MELRGGGEEEEEVEVVHVVLVVVMCLWSGRAGVRMCSER